MKEELQEACRASCFLEVVNRLYYEHFDEKDTVISELVELHNAGSINVVHEFRQLRGGGCGFFCKRTIFEKVLPYIRAPVEDVMDCVKYLVDAAGEDMAANSIFRPFTDFCEAEHCRPKEVLESILANVEEWKDFVALALVAGCRQNLNEYLGLVADLAEHDDLNIRRRAVFALGRIDYCKDDETITRVMSILEKCVTDGQDDELLGNAMKSLFVILTIDGSRKPQIVELIRVALVGRGERVLHAAAEVVAFDSEQIPHDLLVLFLEHLVAIKPENRGTMSMLDRGLCNLLQNKRVDDVTSFLERILIENPEPLLMDHFSSTKRELLGSHQQLVNKLATEWLRSANQALCRAISDIVGHEFEQYVSLTVDTTAFGEQTAGEAVFLARKAIGWLFVAPLSCTCFLISVMERAEQSELEQISELLFNPLLISYPGKVKDYVLARKANQSPAVQLALEQALNKLEHYQAGLNSALKSVEMLPTQGQREAYSRRFSHKMAESMKKARKNSIVSLIATTSVLLYGRKSINYIATRNGETERMESIMQSHDATFEFPRLPIIDPNGLEMSLCSFRMEGVVE